MMNFWERNQFLIAMVFVLILGVLAYQQKSLALSLGTIVLVFVVIGFKIYLNVRATKKNRK